MAKNDNLTDFVKDIADTLRAKKGTTDLINPQDFSNEINGLGGVIETSSWYSNTEDVITFTCSFVPKKIFIYVTIDNTTSSGIVMGSASGSTSYSQRKPMTIIATNNEGVWDLEEYDVWGAYGSSLSTAKGNRATPKMSVDGNSYTITPIGKPSSIFTALTYTIVCIK